jgi:type I restriction enzyme, S subunit
MNNQNQNIPKLRFPEFNGESRYSTYKKYFFKDIFLFSTGKNIKQSEASPDFETPCIRYGELYYMYAEVIYDIINRTNLDKSELLFSNGDEILLPSAGEDPLDIGSASALTIEGVAIGRTINILKPLKDNIYSHRYVAYYINQKLRKKISTLAKGVSISNVYNSDLKKLDIVLPNLPEQHKIASFFTTIDLKISQLKQKLTLLEQYKKGVMQKIFSQEVRFKDDDGQEFPKWENKKIKDLAEIKYGKDQKQISYEKGKYPILGTGGEMGRTNDFLTDKPSVLIGRKGTIDKPRYMDTPFWTVDTLFYTNVYSNTIPKWLYYKFGTINWYLYNEASGVPSLSSSTIYSIPICLPFLPEQDKIADFLSAIDDKIHHIQTQIEKSEVWKKGLLQQMFC